MLALTLARATSMASAEVPDMRPTALVMGAVVQAYLVFGATGGIGMACDSMAGPVGHQPMCLQQQPWPLRYPMIPPTRKRRTASSAFMQQQPEVEQFFPLS